jgi:tetratricopeptide (TPR) repeat protein
VRTSKSNSAAEAFREGRLVDAERLFRRMVRAAPDDADALHWLGIVLHRLGRNEQALGFLERSLRFEPRNSEAENNLATVLKALGRLEDARRGLLRAIALKPNDAALHYNLGNTLMALQHNDAALAAFDRAVGLDARLRPAWQNRGIVLTRLGRTEEALATYDRLIGMFSGAPTPEMAEARANQAWALDRLGRREEALAACEAALALDPNHALAQWNRAPILLAMGDYARGWEAWEWRWHDPNFPGRKRNFSQALWLGREDIAGRTILLHAEQGYGDTIQFCRYVPMVKALGARVVLEAPAPLLPLLRTLEGVDVLIACGDALPEFDVQTPLMSLGLAFDTRVETVPARVPYLAADGAKLAAWQNRLGPARGLRVGLAWSGNADMPSDIVRSAKLEDLEALFIPGVEYVAVQKDVRPADMAAAERLGVRMFGAETQDFSDSAALVSLMDLVISVCSGPAHLAGALGRPLWLLLYSATDWRWLMHRADSPWYPTARLFRQRTAQDWRELAARLRPELEALAAGHQV